MSAGAAGLLTDDREMASEPGLIDPPSTTCAFGKLLFLLLDTLIQAFNAFSSLGKKACYRAGCLLRQNDAKNSQQADKHLADLPRDQQFAGWAECNHLLSLRALLGKRFGSQTCSQCIAT